MTDLRKVRRDSLVEALVVVLKSRAMHIRRLRTMNIITTDEAEEMLGFIRTLKADIDLANKAYDQTTPEEE